MIYSYEHKEQLSAAPGETIDIPVLIRDEINQRADTPVLVINPRYNSSNLLRDNKTVIVGVSKNNITQNSLRNSYHKLHVSLKDCPPGFYYNSEIHSCICSADHPKTSYYAIRSCDLSSFRAKVYKGYWVGMYRHNNITLLYTSSNAIKTTYPYSSPEWIRSKTVLLTKHYILYIM